MFRSRPNLQLLLCRWKHKKGHWSLEDKKIHPVNRALENFDDFYGSVYGNKWKSIRIALLCQHKYMALVNTFGDVEKTTSTLECDGAINVRTLYNITKENLLAQGNDEIISDNKIYKLDNQLDKIITKRRENEILSLYPTNADSTILDAGELNKQSIIEKELEVDFKKSLESTIKENSEIDFTRIVDGFNAGALGEFIPASKIKGMEDWVLESDHYKYYKSGTTDFPLKIEAETEFAIPENVHLYSYERGNMSTFIKPRKCITGVSSHFLMDGGSILPPLVLGVQPGDRVLDACSAPGGKSLVMLQTLYPEMLVCNELLESRMKRVLHLMNEFVFDFEQNWRSKRVFLTQGDAKSIDEYGSYDKVLVDVPCTTDRHAVNENDNNIFKPTRVKERLRLPEQQAAILSNCIRLLKPGGSLVYSTCSLSPIQNDGVIHMALSRVFEEHGITVTIKDLRSVMLPFQEMFRFEHPNQLKYGQLVLPYLPLNFGPMYFCKMVRST